jgi:2-amino-4-hydroxy-6-hydroxymethyldihydropteridine diphosphokinase
MTADEPIRAFHGLGTNHGDRRRHLLDAVAAIPEVRAVSPVYETEPVGGPEQGPFLNIVVEVATRRTPHELLRLCQELERAAGRVRVERWGPRTLDVDIVWMDGITVADADLEIPHPRAHERNFVMRPLLDLAPDLEPVFRSLGYEADAASGAVTPLGPL